MNKFHKKNFWKFYHYFSWPIPLMFIEILKFFFCVHFNTIHHDRYKYKRLYIGFTILGNHFYWRLDRYPCDWDPEYISGDEKV